MVEYRTGAVVDRWGVGAMRAMGFHRVQTIREHSSEISLYER
jgi:hypothetical protein